MADDESRLNFAGTELSYRSAEEALADCIAILGTGYGVAFHHCSQHLWQLSSNWDRYEALYGSKERVDLLNQCSGHFWSTVQDLLHEHVLLGLCRLTDPAGQGKFRNLSVRRLAEVDPTREKDELLRRVRSAVDATGFARTWRDKRIAHNDLDHVTGENSVIEPSTGLKIAAAIVAIHNVLKWVQGRYFDGDMFLMDLGDTDANLVLADLARAKAMKDEERADLEARRFDKLSRERFRYPANDYGRQRRYSAQSALPQPKRYEGPLPLVT